MRAFFSRLLAVVRRASLAVRRGLTRVLLVLLYLVVPLFLPFAWVSARARARRAVPSRRHDPDVGRLERLRALH